MSGGIYEIRIKGNVCNLPSDWFEGMTVKNMDNGEAIISGYVRDQSALHGILIKIRDLGLPLLHVSRVNHE
jgi:hypothetical protein